VVLTTRNHMILTHARLAMPEIKEQSLQMFTRLILTLPSPARQDAPFREQRRREGARRRE